MNLSILPEDRFALFEMLGKTPFVLSRLCGYFFSSLFGRDLPRMVQLHTCLHVKGYVLLLLTRDAVQFTASEGQGMAVDQFE